MSAASTPRRTLQEVERALAQYESEQQSPSLSYRNRSSSGDLGLLNYNQNANMNNNSNSDGSGISVSNGSNSVKLSNLRPGVVPALQLDKLAINENKSGTDSGVNSARSAREAMVSNIDSYRRLFDGAPMPAHTPIATDVNKGGSTTESVRKSILEELDRLRRDSTASSADLYTSDKEKEIEKLRTALLRSEREKEQYKVQLETQLMRSKLLEEKERELQVRSSEVALLKLRLEELREHTLKIGSKVFETQHGEQNLVLKIHELEERDMERFQAIRALEAEKLILIKQISDLEAENALLRSREHTSDVRAAQKLIKELESVIANWKPASVKQLIGQEEERDEIVTVNNNNNNNNNNNHRIVQPSISAASPQQPRVEEPPRIRLQDPLSIASPAAPSQPAMVLPAAIESFNNTFVSKLSPAKQQQQPTPVIPSVPMDDTDIMLVPSSSSPLTIPAVPPPIPTTPPPAIPSVYPLNLPVPATSTPQTSPRLSPTTSIVSSNLLHPFHSKKQPIRPRSAPSHKNPDGDAMIARLAKQCSSEGQLFVDPKFPPSLQSIFRNGRNCPAGSLIIPDPAKIQWLRPEQMSPTNVAPCVFSAETMCDEIPLGVANTGYLLMALAWCSARPDLIEDIIVDAGAYAGLYGVKFHLQGKWHTVVVDSLFPCVDGYPIFAGYRPDAKEIWGMLVEKAWAKLHGSYEAIGGGHVEDACAYLTACAASHIRLHEGNGKEELERGDLWQRVVSLQQQQTQSFGALLTAAGVEAPASRPGDSFLIYGVRQVNNVRLLKLHNPWGKVKWLGDWSDNSTKWNLHPEVAKALNYAPSTQGEFWICWEDFVRVFKSIGVSLINPKWPAQTMQGAWTLEGTSGGLGSNFNKNPMILVKNEHPTIRITLEQIERRRLGEPYAEVYLLVFRVPNYQSDPVLLPNAIKKRIFKTRLESMEIVLDPGAGPYLIVPALTSESMQGSFWLTALSPAKLELTAMNFIPTAHFFWH